MITFDEENFEKDVVNNSMPVLIDFWAPWCGYCRRLAPAVDQLSEEYEGTLIIGRLNIDDNPQLAQKFEVETIPTLILYQNGKASEPLIAPSSKSQITKWLDEHGVKR